MVKKTKSQNLSADNKVFLNIFWAFMGLIFLFVVSIVVLLLSVVNMPVDASIDCGGGLMANVNGSFDVGHRTVQINNESNLSLVMQNSNGSVERSFKYPFSDVTTSDTTDGWINVPDFNRFVLNNIFGEAHGNCKVNVKGSAVAVWVLLDRGGKEDGDN